MATKKLKSGITVGLQSGTERTVYATWGRTAYPNQSGYRIIWEYDTGQGVWFNGSDSTSSGLNATYSAPQNAVGVRVRVGPNPGNKARWKTGWVEAIYNSGWGDGEGGVTNNKPATPSGLTLEVKGSSVIAKVPNYQDAKSNGLLHFQIVANDVELVSEGDAWLVYNMATYTWNLATIGGNRYKARVMAYGNASVNSDWSNYTENKSTPPPKGNITKLMCVSSTSIDVQYDALPGAKTYTIEYTATVVGGKPVFDTGSQDVQSGTSETTHFLASSLEYKKYYFRVRGNGEDNGSVGEWSDIKDVMCGTKPDKPTIWSYTTVCKQGDQVNLNWVHSSEDGSEQSGANLAYTINDGEETVISSLTTETRFTFDTTGLADSSKVKWRVRTRGTQGIVDENGNSIEWGDYSEYREFTVYEAPSIDFSVGVPDETEDHPVIDKFPIHIEGLSSPATQTPVAFYISITANTQYDISGDDGIEIHVGAGEEIYSKYIPTTVRLLKLDISPGEIYLHEGTVYTVTVSVAMTNGLDASESKMFKAKWESTQWDPDGDITIDHENIVAYVRPYCADQWGFEYRKGFTMGLYRIDFDGNLTEIITGLDPADNVTVTDPHPSLDYARYRVTATDNNTGEVSYADINAYPVNEVGAVIQWNGEIRSFFADPIDIDRVINNWSGTILRLPYNVDVADDISPDVSLVEYIGRKHPVSYYGTQQGSTSRWTAEFPLSDKNTLAKLRALSIYPGDVYVREASGTGYWANVKVATSITHNKQTVQVTLAITRVEGGA